MQFAGGNPAMCSSGLVMLLVAGYWVSSFHSSRRRELEKKRKTVIGS
jgi:hypothetical protein